MDIGEAEAKVGQIILDIRNRSGLTDIWEEISPDTKREIVQTWTDILMKKIEEE